MYVSVKKIETVPSTSRSYYTVRKVDLRVVRYTRFKIFHKLALKTSYILYLLRGFSLWSLQVVNLEFSFCANAKFKGIASIVNHHYNVFHVPRRFYSVNKSCSIVLITHDPRLRKHCISSDPLTTPRGKINLSVKLARKYTESTLLALCIEFLHIVFWESIWELCKDHVIM